MPKARRLWGARKKPPEDRAQTEAQIFGNKLVVEGLANPPGNFAKYIERGKYCQPRKGAKGRAETGMSRKCLCGAG